jgi:uncharacterized membrane protein SpoIIM required for sporulation
LREALFIKKNKDRWLRNQEQPSADADEMARDFIQLVDDLAYAKTFYPSGKVTRYINTQASRIYLNIYKNKKEESNRLISYWKYDLPLTIRKHQKTILFCFILFTTCWIIGFYLSKQDESIMRDLLGDNYVDGTMENINKGNPFGVYEGAKPFLSWLWIMVNNILVSLRYFALGIFLGLPTLNDLSHEGLRIGAFDQMFAGKGFGLQFFLVVFVHGTLELTAIIIAAAAGVVLGKSFLFPGTIKRIDALKNGAKDGVKIIIGLLPVFAMAAFFEGFITRLYNDISILTTVIVSLSVLFVIWYFVIYPIRLGRRMVTRQGEEDL